jgi:hypothetical protein
MAKGTRGFLNIMALLPDGVIATSILSLRGTTVPKQSRRGAMRLPRPDKSGLAMT